MVRAPADLHWQLMEDNMTKPIQTVQTRPDTWVVAYFGRIAGYISKVSYAQKGEPSYRALSINGQLQHCRTKTLAQRFILDHAA